MYATLLKAFTELATKYSELVDKHTALKRAMHAQQYNVFSSPTGRRDPERGTGRTSNALRGAPTRSVYVVDAQNMCAMIRARAAVLGRTDLPIISKEALCADNVHSTRHIVVDHAALLTSAQWEFVRMHNHRLACPPAYHGKNARQFILD